MIEKLKKYFEQYLHIDNIVYSSYDVYVILLKKEKNINTNEDKINVINSNTCTYYGDSFTILDIINKYDCTKSNGTLEIKMDTGYLGRINISNETFKFEINKQIQSKNFKYKNDLGVAYYYSLEPAYYKNIAENNDEYTGEYREWYTDGSLYIESEYLNSKLHGEYLEYYGAVYNNSLNIKCHYDNGEMIGTFLSWYPNGQFEVISKYYKMNSDVTWRTTEFFETGKIKRVSMKKNGEYNGWYIKCFPNGNCNELIEYDRGKVCGHKYVFDEQYNMAFHENKNIGIYTKCEICGKNRVYYIYVNINKKLYSNDQIGSGPFYDEPCNGICNECKKNTININTH